MNFAKRILTFAVTAFALCVLVLSVHAVDTSLSAFYTADGVVFDGDANEKAYLLGAQAGTSSRLGVAFDKSYIYVGVIGTQNQTTLGVKIQDTAFEFDLSSGDFSKSMGTSSGIMLENCAELKLSYEDLGLEFSPCDRKLDFSAFISDGTVSLDFDSKILELKYANIVKLDSCEDFSAAGYTNQEGKPSANVTVAQSATTDSAYMFKSVGGTAEGMTNITSSLGGFTVGNITFEYTVKINDLPVIKTEALRAWYGFVFEIQNVVRRRFSLSADTDGSILANVLYNDASNSNGRSESVDTGKNIGDIFTVKGVMDGENNLDLYIDGVFLHTYEKIDKTKNYNRTFFALGGGYYSVASGTLDVDMLDFALYTPIDALENISFDAIKGDNPDKDNIVCDLSLPQSIEYDGKNYAVTWQSNKTDIISHDGILNKSALCAGKEVVLTANVTIGGEDISKSIAVTVSDAFSAPFLNAYFLAATPIADADLSDSITFFNAEFADIDAVAGAMWTTEGFAIGIDMGTYEASNVGVSIGNKSFVFDMASGVFDTEDDGVSGAVNGSIVELFFTYEACGTSFCAAERNLILSLSVSDGASTYFADEKLITTICATPASYDNCDSYEDMGYSEKTKYQNYAEISFTQKASSYHFAHSTQNVAIYGIGKTAGGVTMAPYELEMKITANDLPVITPHKLAGWYGIAFDLSNKNLPRTRLSLTADTAGNILFNILHHDSSDANGSTETLDTGKELGDTFTMRVSVDEAFVPTLYIDGNEIGSLGAIDYIGKNNHTYYELQLGYSNVESGGLDFELHGLALSRKIALLEKLSFDDIKGNNTSADAIFTDLSLPQSVTFGDTGIEVPLTWKSSDTSFISHDGVLTYAGDSVGKTVIMTVTAYTGGERVTRDFTITLNFETVDHDLYFLFNDSNPYTGKLTKTGINFDFILDANENSVGIDLGEVQNINYVCISDADGIHKIRSNEISLYVSNDNEAFTRIENYDLFRTQNKLCFANFEVSARFVKVHCHIATNEYVGFINKLDGFVTAYHSNTLVADGGGEFEKLSCFNVKSSGEITDGIAFVEFDRMGLSDSVLESGMDKIRFAIGERTLRHFIDKNDGGAYIRIPEAASGQVISVDIYGNNPYAENISDAETVFEVTYGNRTIKDVTEANFNHVISTAKCPNGDIIAIGSKEINKSMLTIRRSTDGGRTWGEPKLFWDNGRNADGCAFLVDGNKMWCIFHIFPIPSTSYYTLNVAILMSDDNGYTWKNPQTGSSTPYFPQTGKFYSNTYCDGVKVASFDGAGEGVDYLFSYAHCSDSTCSDFKVSVIYSKDGGITWQTSESNIGFTPEGGTDSAFEAGVSETSIVELDDGTLTMYARVQFDGVVTLGKSSSYDHGITWEENCTLTEIYSPNTFPLLKRYNDDVLLLWAGNNIEGGTSYQRTPMNIAYSTDNMQTWNKKLDIWSGTSEGKITDGSHKGTQPKMTFDNYMGNDNILVAWWKYRSNKNYTLLIEDAEDYIYKTKGVADSFETTSTLYEGWAEYAGTVEITDEKSSIGTHSLKISDVNKKITRVSRSMPELYKGELSFDFNLENASTYMYVELKSPLSFSHYTGDKMAFCIDTDGNILAVNAKSKEHGSTLATVETDKWYNIKVRFDINAGSAILLLDGKEIGELPINSSVYGGVCFLHISDGSSSQAAGLTAYIDNFRAYEGTSFELASVSEKPVQVAINLERDMQSTPYAGNLARMDIYADSGKSKLVKSVVLESADTVGGKVITEISLESGVYHAVVLKNGYLPYEASIVVDDDTVSIPEITLTPGDIKNNYTDFSGDGVIDIDDFLRVLRGFSTDVDALLKEAVDINEDREITVEDLVAIKLGLGNK